VSSGEEIRCRWRAAAAELSVEVAAVLSAAAEQTTVVLGRRLGKRPVGRRTSSW
jgi:hypothetical protein